VKQYNKLVRDKIPEIIEKSGRRLEYEILTNDAYRTELDKKLDEEISEYRESRNLEELADIIEVLYALCESSGSNVKELEQIRKKKAAERGSFKNKIYLKCVE